jgi:3-methyladenine DNA glycosylase AlkD
LGVAATQINEIAKEFLKTQGSQLGLKSVCEVAQDLWKTGYLEARLLGLLMLKRFENQFDDHIWQLADRWLNEIDDWSLCDTVCVCLTAPVVAADVSKMATLMEWTEAQSPWRRRAAVVSLRRLNRRGQAQPEATFRVCERLMQDAEWPVRKAVGFTLRDIGLEAPEQQAEFLKQWKPKTHRSIIREATKRLPPNLRQAVLSG